MTTYRLTRPMPSEADIQATVIEWLLCVPKLTVIDTTRHRRKCLLCGAIDHRGDGISTRGLGDLLIWVPYKSSYDRFNYWAMVDIKTPAGKLSAEQKVHVDACRMLIWRSLDDCISWYEAL